MQWRKLAIEGAWVSTPDLHTDERGTFLEVFRNDELAEALGHRFDLAQVNCSVSAAGVVRGIHFTATPPGQAKYVTCTRGAVLDVVVDVRVGSPTFGRWEAVLLDDADRRAVYLSEGLGHGFCSLEDDSTVVYLCSSTYAPDIEREVNAFDPQVGIAWPTTARDGSPLTHVRSPKDHAAPSLASARDAGLLPEAGTVARFLQSKVEARS